MSAIRLFGVRPSWGLPCISPFVTKVATYLTMARIPFELVSQDPRTVDQDSPTGKLPYLRVADGPPVADSTAILEHLKATHGDTFDEGASATERAQMVAFSRLVEEHLYWTGVVRPRWADEANWPRYREALFGVDLPPPVLAFADAYRKKTLDQLAGAGIGRMPAALADARARADVAALASFLGDKPFFMGDRPRSVDATLTAMLRHVLTPPFDSEARRAATSSAEIGRYLERMAERFDV